MLEETRRFWNYTKPENMSIWSIHLQIMLFSLSWTYRVDVPVPNKIFFMQQTGRWSKSARHGSIRSDFGGKCFVGSDWREFVSCISSKAAEQMGNFGPLESAVSTGNYRRAFWTSLKTVGLEAKTWIHLFWMILACTCMDGSGLCL